MLVEVLAVEVAIELMVYSTCSLVFSIISDLQKVCNVLFKRK